MRRPQNPRDLLLLGFVLAVGIALRAYRFPDLPVGPSMDEAYNLMDALQVLEGERPLFFEANNGREPLFIYSIAISAAHFGSDLFGLRLPAFLFGVVSLPLLYLFAREWGLAMKLEQRWAVHIGLLATALLATSYWHLNFSRFAFRAITLPFFELLAMGALWRALRTASVSYSLVAGAAFGATTYTYLSARAIPVWVLLWAPSLVWKDDGRSRWRLLGVVFLAWALVSAPLGIYFIQHSDVFLARPNQASILHLGLPALSENLVRVLFAPFLAGDENPRHNLPGRPVFDPLIAIAFVAGIGLALVRCIRTPSDRPALWFALAGTAVMWMPSVVSEGAPHFLRAIGALPLMVLWPALALALLGRTAESSGAPWARVGRYAIVGALVFSGYRTVADYFGVWAERPDIYYAFGGNVAAAVHRVAQWASLPGPVWLDFRVFDDPAMTLRWSTPPVLRFDPDQQLPLAETGGTYIVSVDMADLTRMTDADGRSISVSPAPQLHRGLADLLEKAASEQNIERDADGRPYAVVFHLDRDGVCRVVSLLTGDGEPFDSARGRLQAVAIEPAAGLDPGGEAAIRLLWEGLTSDSGLWYSSRLRSADGVQWSQRDGPVPRKADSARWLVERVSLPVPADLPPGAYTLSYSLYRPNGGPVPFSRADGGPSFEILAGPVENARWPSADSRVRPQFSIHVRTESGLQVVGATVGSRSVRPGDRVEVHLYVANPTERPVPARVQVQVVDVTGVSRTVGGQETAEAVLPGRTLWHLVRTVTLGPAMAGPSRIEAGLAGHPSPIVFPGPEILPQTRPTATSPPRYWTDVDFGSAIRLDAMDISAVAIGDSDRLWRASNGDSLTVDLYWRAVGPIDDDLTVFVQAIGPDGQPAFQTDARPVGGEAPTRGWTPGEVVRDPKPLHIPAGTRPGLYRLIVGLYRSEDGRRLLTQYGTDHYQIGSLEVDVPPESGQRTY